MFSQNKRDLS